MRENIQVANKTSVIARVILRVAQEFSPEYIVYSKTQIVCVVKANVESGRLKIIILLLYTYILE